MLFGLAGHDADAGVTDGCGADAHLETGSVVKPTH